MNKHQESPIKLVIADSAGRTSDKTPEQIAASLKEAAEEKARATARTKHNRQEYAEQERLKIERQEAQRKAELSRQEEERRLAAEKQAEHDAAKREVMRRIYTVVAAVVVLATLAGLFEASGWRYQLMVIKNNWGEHDKTFWGDRGSKDFSVPPFDPNSVEKVPTVTPPPPTQEPTPYPTIHRPNKNSRVVLPNGVDYTVTNNRDGSQDITIQTRTPGQ